MILVGAVAPPKANPDEYAYMTFNDAFGGSFSGRINMNLREDKHWAYGAGSFAFDARGQRPWIIYAPVQTDKTKESVQEVLKELREVTTTRPLSTEELDAAKDRMTRSLAGRWETGGARVRRHRGDRHLWPARRLLCVVCATRARGDAGGRGQPSSARPSRPSASRSSSSGTARSWSPVSRSWGLASCDGSTAMASRSLKARSRDASVPDDASALAAGDRHGAGGRGARAGRRGCAGRVDAAFDGSQLGQWEQTSFGGEGPVSVRRRRDRARAWAIRSPGSPGRARPCRPAFEIALEAARLAGSDFFCALTFPVGRSHCSLILGGWGGTTVGLSSLDGLDASENETTREMRFEDKRWYRVRVAVTATHIRAWLDDQPIVEVVTAGRRIGIRPEVDASRPLGIASYRTRAGVRAIRVRKL